MAPTKLRLGTCSPSTQATTTATLAQLSSIAHRAAARSIDILLLPEAYIGGYPRGQFGCVVGGRKDGEREEYLKYFKGAVDLGDIVGEGGAGAGVDWVRRTIGVDGPRVDEDVDVDVDEGFVDGAGGRHAGRLRGDGTREEIERIARETGVFLVVGCIEKAGGSLYCAAVYVCPRLGMIGKRRKVMPTGAERLIWAQGSPATLRAVTTTIRGVRVNLAAAICWENYMPVVRQSLYAQNVNLYLAPTADGRDAWLSLMRTVGIEGRCFVVSSNMCVVDGANSTVKTEDEIAEQAGNASASGHDDRSHPLPMSGRVRRKSCVTEEGFEIALPSPSSEAKTPGSSSHRRLSVFDDDGNEIALPLPSTSHQQPLPSRRRLSVFDDDGNEIVLCCGKKADGATAAQDASQPASPSTSTKLTHANGHDGTAAPTKTATGSLSATKETKFLSRGGSSIISPFGDVLAGPQWEDPEGLIWTDVDFDDCIRGRLDLDVAGSYSRNDSFKFSVEGLDLTPLPY